MTEVKVYYKNGAVMKTVLPFRLKTQLELWKNEKLNLNKINKIEFKAVF